MLVMLAGGFEPLFLRIFFLDREALRRHLIELPYRQLPGLQRLLLTARTQTIEGEKVGFWMDSPRWKEGYEYAYKRAGYPMAGRQVIPLIDSGSRLREAALKEIDVLVCWRCRPPFPEFRISYQTPDGVVARR